MPRSVRRSAGENDGRGLRLRLNRPAGGEPQLDLVSRLIVVGVGVPGSPVLVGVRGGLLGLGHGTSVTRDARPTYAGGVRAIQVTRFGPPEVLTLATLPDPTPAPGEVRVRVHAIGVNFSDTERRRAVFDPPELPWVPGREAAGVVDVVGEGVDPALAGARVAYYSRRRGGAYAELATVAVDELLHFPDSVPFTTMAAVPVQGLTALGLVHLVAGTPEYQFV